MVRVSPLVFLGFFLVACGNGDKQSFRQDVIAGTWSNCSEFDQDYELFTAEMGDGKWVDTYKRYLDSRCTELADDIEDVVYSGRYTIGNEIILNDGISAYEIDWSYDEPIDEDVTSPCYSLVSVQGDTLFYGLIEFEANDCSTEEKRSTELYYNSPMIRVK